LFKRLELVSYWSFGPEIKNHLIFYLGAKQPFFFYFLFSDFEIFPSGQIKDGSGQSYRIRFTSLLPQDLHQSRRQIGWDFTIIFRYIIKLIILANFFPEIKIKKEPDERTQGLPASPGQTQTMEDLFLFLSSFSGPPGSLHSFLNPLFFLFYNNISSKTAGWQPGHQSRWPDNPDFQKLMSRDRYGLKPDSSGVQYL